MPMTDAQPDWMTDQMAFEMAWTDFREDYIALKAQQPRQLDFYYGGRAVGHDPEPYLAEVVETELGHVLLQEGIRFGLNLVPTAELPGHNRPLLVLFDHDRPRADLMEILRDRPPMSYFMLIGMNIKKHPHWTGQGEPPPTGTQNYARIRMEYSGYRWMYHTIEIRELSPFAAQRLREWLALFTH